MEPLADSFGGEAALPSLPPSALACSQEKKDKYSQQSMLNCKRLVAGRDASPEAERM